MEQGVKIRNEIVEGVIWKQMLFFFLPLWLTSFFQQLYNTADAVIVGQALGKLELSAVGGASGTLINIFLGFFLGLSTGVTVIISQHYGAENFQEVNQAVHTAIALAVIFGVFVTLVGVFGAGPALKLMGTPDEIFPYALTFLRIIFWGMVANMVYNIGAGILRAIGDTKRPLYFLIISSIINVLLVLLLLTVFHMGVEGVALATVIAQMICAALIIATLIRTRECCHLRLRDVRLHKEVMLRILKIGLPAGFQSLMYTSANIIVQTTMNSFGTNTVAAWAAYSKIDVFYWITVNSFGASVTTFTGQNYGAGRYSRISQGTRICLGIAMLVSVFLSCFIYFGACPILTLFTDDRVIADTGLVIVHFLAPVYVVYVIIEVLTGTLRGIGNTFIPMLVSVFGICILRITWLLVAVPVRPDLRTVLFGYPLTWSVTAAAIVIYYWNYIHRLKRKWK